MSAHAPDLDPGLVPEGAAPEAASGVRAPAMSTPRWVRVVTVLAVSVVAAVAAVVSYVHMRELAEQANEEWRAYIIPLSADGLLVAASMVMLVRRRAGGSAGVLAWLGLVLGLLASVGANLAVADWSDPVSIAVSGWPPLALAVAFELLIQVTRTGPDRPVEPVVPIMEPVVPDCELEEWTDPWDRWAEEVVRTAETEHQTTGPTTSDREPGPVSDRSGTAQTTPAGPGETTPAQTTPEPPSDQRYDGETTGPDHLFDEAVRWAAKQAGPISQRAVRTRFGVGRDRAVSILEHINQTRGTA